jgi:hypothetical protein
MPGEMAMLNSVKPRNILEEGSEDMIPVFSVIAQILFSKMKSCSESGKDVKNLPQPTILDGMWGTYSRVNNNR